MENKAPVGTPFRGTDYFKITVLGFALAAVANTMHAIILPLRIQDLVGGELKSTYLGLLTFAGLVIAILVQPIAGAISDRSGFHWGRRRPFILAGIIAALIMLFGLGTADLYVIVFIFWCLMQASLNVAQGPFQAFIPDLVPSGKRGLASGVKNLIEIAGGVALLRLVGNLMSNQPTTSGNSWLWLSLGVLGLVLLAAMLITVLSVRERPGTGISAPFNLSLLYNSFQVRVKGNSGFVLFLISRLLFIMALTTLQSFALYYFQDVVDIVQPAKVTADLITVVGIAMLVVVYPAGRLSDKVGRKPILTACGLLAALGISLIISFPHYNWILFAGALIGIAAGSFLSTNWALATDLIPQEEAGRYLGIANLASAGGSALARLIGPLIDSFNGFGAGTGYSVMLGACFCYFIISSILIWQIRIHGISQSSSSAV